MDFVLETNDLTKHYKTTKALERLTMHVEKGAIYGFVGRNGAGKTTLIRLICGLQAPTGGSFSRDEIGRASWRERVSINV